MIRNLISTLAALAIANSALAATPPPPPPPMPNVGGPAAPAPAPAADNKGKEAEGEKGFTSKKTGKSMSKAEIEDINNENFPDMIESFDYPNAEINDLVHAISELTGKNFIVDPQVHGKITIIAPSRITVAEAYKAFLSALAINGLAVVPGDGFYKIKQARAAQRDNIDTFSGAYYPTSDQMITRIVKLRYISADEVNKQLRILTSKDGELVPYTPTNSMIISDYGANMDRIMKILAQLDVQGFEEQMEVIRIKYARAKDISDLIDQIINKGKKDNQFGGVPRFRPAGETSGGTSGAEVYSVVVPDDRTNSIIVVGNKAGVDKIRHLVSRLDFPMRADEQGGFHVYYLRHAEAEPLANIINGIAGESKKAVDQANQAKTPSAGIGPGGMIQSGPAATAIFGGDVKVSPDKSTNSLVIVASKQDYETVRNLIAKVDIAKDQVFIKSIIMEMNTNDTDQWGVNYYKFGGDPQGIGRIGFRGGGIDSIINPANDSGGVLGFGTGGNISMTIAGTPVQVPSLSGLINILKSEVSGNILSTPQVMALNNEESTIEVGSKVPVAKNDTATSAGAVTSNITRENVTTKMVITPFISPDTDEVKLKIEQEVAGLSQENVLGAASELAKNSIVTTTRKIKTSLVVNSGDTAVLGGLMSDEDDDSVTKVPVLGDIPVIGWLFKQTKKTKKKNNLLVFITPKIVRTQAESASILDQKISERIDFIKDSMNGRDPHGKYIDALPRVGKAGKPPVEKPDMSNPPPPSSSDIPESEPPPAPEEPAVESF